MRKLTIYDGTKTYMYPNGTLATPERVLIDFPAITAFPHVVETDEGEQVLGAVMNLSQLRSNYAIDPSLTIPEAVAELEYLINNPPEPVQEVTVEERIASALEFNNLLNM